MSYIRVLPRDLFNEASLLKCLGQLWIKLDETAGHAVKFEQDDVDSFDIVQDENSGAIYAANVTLNILGRSCILTRPLNSRQPWPLYVESREVDFDPVSVFNDDGSLSKDMLELIQPLNA